MRLAIFALSYSFFTLCLADRACLSHLTEGGEGSWTTDFSFYRHWQWLIPLPIPILACTAAGSIQTAHCKWRDCENPILMSGSDLCVPRYGTARPRYFPHKQNYNVLSPNFHIHVSVSYIYIFTIGLPRTDRIRITDHRFMNVEIGNEAAQFHI